MTRLGQMSYQAIIIVIIISIYSLLILINFEIDFIFYYLKDNNNNSKKKKRKILTYIKNLHFKVFSSKLTIEKKNTKARKYLFYKSM